MILWASAFIVIRSVGDHYSPGSMALGRLAAGSVALSLVAALRPRRIPRGRPLLLVIGYGVLWFGIYAVLVNAAEHHLDAGTTALVVNVGPILIAVLAGVYLKEGFPRGLVTGLVIAFSGVVTIAIATSTGRHDAVGVLLALGAAALYAVGVLLQKQALRDVDPFTATWLGCLAGTVACLPFAPDLLAEVRDAPRQRHAGRRLPGPVPHRDRVRDLGVRAEADERGQPELVVLPGPGHRGAAVLAAARRGARSAGLRRRRAVPAGRRGDPAAALRTIAHSWQQVWTEAAFVSSVTGMTHYLAEVADAWQESWDRQQEAYLPDREHRIATMLDAVEAVTPDGRPRVLDLAGGTGTISLRALAPVSAARRSRWSTRTRCCWPWPSASLDGAGATIVSADLSRPSWLDALPHRDYRRRAHRDRAALAHAGAAGRALWRDPRGAAHRRTSSPTPTTCPTKGCRS